MECHDAVPFVSSLHDGEPVSSEAGEHIAGCPSCRERLREYAEIGTELRLLACTRQVESQEQQLPVALRTAQARWPWSRAWTGRILLPRFAVGLGVAIIVALSVGLGLVRAQSRGQWFRYQLSSPEMVGAGPKAFGSGQAGSRLTFLFTGANGAVGAQIEVIEIRDGVVRLGVRARRFSEQKANQPSVRVGENLDVERALEGVRPQQYSYIPVETLAIPLDSGGELDLTGQVLAKEPDETPLAPKADEIVLNQPALARGKELLSQGPVEVTASASGENPGAAMYVPGEGRFVMALHPFEGALKGEVRWSRGRFTLEGQEYLLFCASPITGGDQPRPIWIYWDRSYLPSRAAGPGQDDSPSISSADDVTNLVGGSRH